MTSIDLREITRGLQEAASATNSLIAQQYINLFDQFFEEFMLDIFRVFPKQLDLMQALLDYPCKN